VSLLALYRPNFCSECGSKIIRLRWYLWTSRKYCDKCVRSFRKQQWIQPIGVALIVLIAGILIGRATRKDTPPIIINRTIVTNETTAASTPLAVATSDEVYVCGARTKKGTPCSRRVHGPTRCWQHKGLPAMLPNEKLIVK
jgi:hypothetical protein